MLKQEMYAIHFIEANKIQYNIPEWQKYNFFQVCMPVTNKVLKISQNDFTFWLLAIIYFGILICKAYMVQYHRYVDLNATQCPNC